MKRAVAKDCPSGGLWAGRQSSAERRVTKVAALDLHGPLMEEEEEKILEEISKSAPLLMA